MARKRHSDEDILRLLREIEVNLHHGMGVVSACRKAGVLVRHLFEEASQGRLTTDEEQKRTLNIAI